MLRSGDGNGCYYINSPLFNYVDGNGMGNGFVFDYALNSTSGISYGDGEGLGTGRGTGKGSHRDAKGRRPDERWRKL